MAITGVQGTDVERVEWKTPTGERYLKQEATVRFSMSAFSIGIPNPVGGRLSFSVEPPREHFRFLAIDVRNLTTAQQLALNVLLGEADAVYLAESVMESHHLSAK